MTSTLLWRSARWTAVASVALVVALVMLIAASYVTTGRF